MKKTIPVILILALVLSAAACSLFGKPFVEPTGDGDAVVSPTPAAEPSPAVPDGSPALELPALPDLPPYAPPAEIGGRVDTFADGFVPGGYGAVYPYPAARVATDYYTEPLTMFGFATADGKIICGGVYSSVTRLESADGAVAYLARRALYAHRPDGAWVEEQYAQYAVDFITGDGSVLQTYDDAVDAHCDLISVKSGGYWGVIDYRGNTVLAPSSVKSAYAMYAGRSGAAPDSKIYLIKSRVDGTAATEDSAGEYGKKVSYVYTDVAGRELSPRYTAFLPPLEFGPDPFNSLMAQLCFSEGAALYYPENAPDDGNVHSLYLGGNFAKLTDIESFSTAQFRDGYAEVLIRAEPPSNPNGGSPPDYVTEYYWLLPDGSLVEPRAYDNGYTLVDSAEFMTITDADGDTVPRPAAGEGQYVRYLGNGWFALAPTDYYKTGFMIFEGGDYRYALDILSASQTNSLFARADGTLFAAYYTDLTTYATIAALYAPDGTVLYVSGKDEQIQLSRSPYPHYAGAPLILSGGWVTRPPYMLYAQEFGALSSSGELIIPVEYEYLAQYGENYAAVRGRFGGLIGSGGEWLVRVDLSDSLSD